VDAASILPQLKLRETSKVLKRENDILLCKIVQENKNKMHRKCNKSQVMEVPTSNLLRIA
jgi:hypothetical protein